MKVNRNQLLLSGTLVFAIVSWCSSTLAEEHTSQTNAEPAFGEQLMHSMEIMDKDMTAAEKGRRAGNDSSRLRATMCLNES